MSHRHTICLVIDGLRASSLGTYGNTLFPTAEFDAIASRSLVADHCFANSTDAEDFYRSLWTGLHPMRREKPTESAGLLDGLHKDKVLQWLVTDDPWMSSQAGGLPFDEALLFENDSDQSAVELEETCLGAYFSQVIEHLHQWREDVEDRSSLAWLHCQGLHGAWDAPISLRESLLDEEDPVAPDFIKPPTELIGVEDPDDLLSYRVAYAAQVKLLDVCVGAFFAAVEELFAGTETQIIILGARGFALGEHGLIGSDCVSLYSENTHLPCLIYPIGNTIPIPRQSSLVQPMDIGATLFDWFSKERSTLWNDGVSLTANKELSQDVARQLVVAGHAGTEQAIRTPAWMMRQIPTTDDLPSIELYAKPDDRWESNNVADLCPEITRMLSEELVEFEQNCQSGQQLKLVPQNEELITLSR